MSHVWAAGLEDHVTSYCGFPKAVQVIISYIISALFHCVHTTWTETNEHHQWFFFFLTENFFISVFLPHFLLLSFHRLFRSSINNTLITPKKIRRLRVVHSVTPVFQKWIWLPVLFCAAPLLLLACQSAKLICQFSCIVVLLIAGLRSSPVCLIISCAVADITGASADSSEINGSPPMTIKNAALSWLASELSYNKESEATGRICREQTAEIRQ